MKSEGVPTEDRAGEADADEATVADLRLRLQGSLEQQLASRGEMRRLARELALARRLLKFSFGGAMSARQQAKAAAIPRLRATLIVEEVVYHLDACEDRGTFTAISGWAFHPAPSWNSRDTTVTILFRHGTTTYYAAAGCVPRPDVAAHYALQVPHSYGGARGLESAGFACEVLHDSLPANVDWEIALRLECAGKVCVQPTSHRLRL